MALVFGRWFTFVLAGLVLASGIAFAQSVAPMAPVVPGASAVSSPTVSLPLPRVGPLRRRWLRRPMMCW
jgi:hypothetical protein